jgi:hypothetical protein
MSTYAELAARDWDVAKKIAAARYALHEALDATRERYGRDDAVALQLESTLDQLWNANEAERERVTSA